MSGFQRSNRFTGGSSLTGTNFATGTVLSRTRIAPYLRALRTQAPVCRCSSRFLAWVLEAFQTEQRGDLPIYVATNTYWEALDVELPAIGDLRWYRVVDTSLAGEDDIVGDEEAVFLNNNHYRVQPRSTIVLIAH